MSSITFSGLASGLDTDSIIESLMEIEREPVDSLEADVEYFDSETEAFSNISTTLAALQDAVEAMDTVKELSAYSATSSDQSLLSATAETIASAGTYHIEVLSLAETQKDVSAEGFSDTDTEILSGSLTIGGTTIDYSDVTLSELVDLISDSDVGLQATMINDGTESGYRLVLSGDEAGVETVVLGTGSITIDTATDGHTYDSAQAHIVVDNIDIYSNSNTLTSAITGVTLDLIDAESGETLTVTVASDTSQITATVDTFVSAYNSVIDLLADEGGNGWGNDSSLTSIQRKMQNFLTTQVSGSDSFTSLVQLGFKTDYETGQLSVDSSVFNEALNSDPEGVLGLFAGDSETDGIADLFGDYLDVQTDSVDGVYARRKTTNDANITRIENRVEIMEMRLEKREDYLRAQYTALETLISEMNAQTSYLDEISALNSD